MSEMEHPDCTRSWERIKDRDRDKPYPPADIISKARRSFGLQADISHRRIAQVASDVCQEFPEWNISAIINDLVEERIYAGDEVLVAAIA